MSRSHPGCKCKLPGSSPRRLSLLSGNYRRPGPPRPEPGQHLFQYYCRTVAHNCILIHMPGEKLPRYWGSPAPGEEDTGVVNDGGQISQLGSELAAFETNPHFTYLASDATKCYSDEKCRLALRQFVFIPPDYFVVLDRVTSTDPITKRRGSSIRRGSRKWRE